MLSKGKIIFWEISDFNLSKEALQTTLDSLGIEGVIPRNDYRSAMIKALKDFTKGNEKLYRKFNDGKDSTVSFGVYTEQIAGGRMELPAELCFTVSKTDGSLSYNPDQHFPESLKDAFRQSIGTLDSGQFRTLILGLIRKNCLGVPMRSGGGIYFIDERKAEALTKIRGLFMSLPNTRLFEIPVYDDAGTLVALEKATSEDVFTEIETLVKDVDERFKKGTITVRGLEGQRAKIQELIEKVEFHSDNLSSKAQSLKEKAVSFRTLVDRSITNVEAGVKEQEDFLSLLKDV